MAKTKRRIKAQTRAPISPVLIGIVVIASILVVAGLIFLGNQTGGAAGPVDVSQFPAKGEFDAPITIVEYSDYG